MHAALAHVTRFRLSTCNNFQTVREESKLRACAALGAMVSQLSVDEVADLLKNEGFKENVVKLFVENEVDGEALLLLEKREHLNRIGLVKLGDIVKFEMFISRLRESSTTEDAPALTGPSQTVRTQYSYL